MVTKQKTVERDKPKPALQISFFESTAGLAHIHIQMPLRDFNALQKVMQKPKTMVALCRASKTVGLDKVIQGSTFCARCYPGGSETGVHMHEFGSKTWIDAFFKALWYCKGAFQLSQNKCSVSSPYDYPIEYH